MKAPFPWFGGKSRVAGLVWERFGDVYNYLEPFAGSLAVLLARPRQPRIETVNDIDCYLSNFWRALARAPEEVARWADWPVNEADLHARHRALVAQDVFRERMRSDPDFYDAKVAGWWVWGISMWIGDDWCKIRPAKCPEQRPDLCNNKGVHSVANDVSDRTPHTFRNRGIHRGKEKGRFTYRPNIGFRQGIHATNVALLDYFEALASGLRHVRVCCGDWKRVTGPTPTYLLGLTGVFLDPPYGDRRIRKVYNFHDRDVAAEVREYAVANGDNPKLRIAVCGYEGEHKFPKDWECVAWKANGGYANHGKDRKANAGRERIRFSPHCLKVAKRGLFEKKA